MGLILVKNKKINNKIFNKTKKIIKKNSDVLKMNSSISDIKKSIDIKFDSLAEIEIKALIIKSKIESVPKNFRMESVIEELSVTTLKELNGDFSNKLRYKDLSDLYKMNRQSVKIIEEQQVLLSKERILSIELLQKQIEILLGDEK